jgi:hypothetical protein
VVTPAGAAVGVDTGIRLSTLDAEADHAALRANTIDAAAEILRMRDYVTPLFSFREPDGNRLVVVEQTQ